MPDTRTVTIPAVDEHDGHARITVTVPWVCLVCGGPRNEPWQGRSYDGSRSMVVHTWGVNPCGHRETYGHIRAHLPELDATSEPVACPRCATGDHTGHTARFAGICIGCPCTYRDGQS